MLDLAAARREALFCSTLDCGPHTRAEVAAAIAQSVRDHHGIAGCAADMAAEFGDHPEVAVTRMRWAAATVAASYPRRRAGLVAA